MSEQMGSSKNNHRTREYEKKQSANFVAHCHQLSSATVSYTVYGIGFVSVLGFLED